MTLYLYLIEQDRNDGYDTYDSAVVVAKSAAQAKRIHPGEKPLDEDRGTWTNDPDDVAATQLGVAGPKLKAGDVLCASFNAG